MSFIIDFERELMQRINSGEDAESITRWVSEEVLLSYRNGIKAGQKGAQVKRSGKSRRRAEFGKEPRQEEGAPF